MRQAVARNGATSGEQAAGRPARRFELDWIRTLVVLGLVPVHTASLFTPTADLYLKNPETSPAMTLIGVFLGVFGMPLLFFVAGAASWFGLDTRTNARYVKERFSRLLVPLIFAMFTVIPLQVYVVALSNPSIVTAIGTPITVPNFLHSFIQFYPQYLLSFVYFLGHPSVTGFIAFVGHLWFLLYLIVFSLVALPLFRSLKSPRGRRLIAWLAAFAERPGAIFAFCAPLVVVDAFAHLLWTGAGFVAETVVYLALFIYGYALYADARFERAIRRQWGLALALGAGLWVIAEQIQLQHAVRPYDNSMGSLFAVIPLRGVIAWFWVVGLVGFAMTWLSQPSRLMRYLAQAAYPIYVLHVAAIISVGYLLLGWNAPILFKYLVIMLAGYAITFGVFDLFIRRIPVLRLLFGLRAVPMPPPSPPRAAGPGGVGRAAPSPWEPEAASRGGGASAAPG